MKRNKLVPYFLIPIFGVTLIAQDNLMRGNISGLTVDVKFYLVAVAFYLFMGLTFKKTITKVASAKMGLLALIGVMMSIIVPYSFENHFVALIHIINAYLGFGLFSLVIFKTINDFKVYNYHLAKNLNHFWFLSLFCILLLSIKFMAINGIIEIIYLLSVDITLGIIEQKCN